MKVNYYHNAIVHYGQYCTILNQYDIVLIEYYYEVVDNIPLVISKGNYTDNIFIILFVNGLFGAKKSREPVEVGEKVWMDEMDERIFEGKRGTWRHAKLALLLLFYIFK